MASHVIGPLIIANDLLRDEEIARLAQTKSWSWYSLQRPEPIPARPRRIKVYQPQVVTLERRRPEPVLLPRRHG